MRKQYITLAQYLKQEKKISDLKEAGVRFIHKKSKIKIALGCVCLSIAIIPNGLGLICYPLGLSLLTSGGIDLYTLIKHHKQRVRFWLWKRGI